MLTGRLPGTVTLLTEKTSGTVSDRLVAPVLNRTLAVLTARLAPASRSWSFARDDDRPDVDYLLLTPTLLYRPAPRWWVLTDTEVK